MPPLKGSPAELLLKKVHEKYLSLETYQDEGVLVRTTTFPDRKEEQRTEFRTRFKRPDLFRFEWSEEGSKSILFHFGGETLLVTGDEKVCHRFSDLNSGIAAATGISHGLVHDIPSHFSSDSIGFILAEHLKEPRQIAGEEIEGEPCSVLFGEHPHGGGKCKIFVGQESFLIKRISNTRRTTIEDHKSAMKYAQRMMKMAKANPDLFGRIFPDLEGGEAFEIPEIDFDANHEYEKVSDQIIRQVRTNQEIPDSEFKPIIPNGCVATAPEDFAKLVDLMKGK